MSATTAAAVLAKRAAIVALGLRARRLNKAALSLASVRDWWTSQPAALRYGLLGAGLGAGVGLGANQLRDEEDRHPWQAAITGALAGGAAMGGGRLAWDELKGWGTGNIDPTTHRGIAEAEAAMQPGAVESAIRGGAGSIASGLTTVPGAGLAMLGGGIYGSRALRGLSALRGLTTQSAKHINDPTLFARGMNILTDKKNAGPYAIKGLSPALWADMLRAEPAVHQALVNAIRSGDVKATERALESIKKVMEARRPPIDPPLIASRMSDWRARLTGAAQSQHYGGVTPTNIDNAFLAALKAEYEAQGGKGLPTWRNVRAEGWRGLNPWATQTRIKVLPPRTAATTLGRAARWGVPAAGLYLLGEGLKRRSAGMNYQALVDQLMAGTLQQRR